LRTAQPDLRLTKLKKVLDSVSFFEETLVNRKISRRRFLQAGGASAVAAGFWLTGGVTESHARQPGANDRLNIAIVGCGGQGAGNASQSAIRSENIVALCDVDANRARTIFDRYPNLPKYTDFRVMFDRHRDIQAVVVSTPDHTHFHASAHAIRRGKHVYTEKPLTHSVWEARQLKLLASRHKVSTSMGNHGTAAAGIRTGAEIIRSGAIGDVREVHVWTNRPGTFWRQGQDSRPNQRPEVPATLAWDLWLGPAPERPYHSDYAPFAWRGWWDFGTGGLGDMGCHTMNLAFMALQLGPPSSIVAETDRAVNNESPPNGLMVTYEFPARGNRRALTLKWYEVRRPAANLFDGEEVRSSGSLFIGSRGKLYSPDDYGSTYILLPRADFRNYRLPQPTIPRSPGHHAEWIRACKGGEPAMANFVDYAGPLTEIVLLGNVAIRTGRRLAWDSERLQATDLPAAAPFIRRAYRRGWDWNP
jgi:predicted dehydrogenase